MTKRSDRTVGPISKEDLTHIATIRKPHGINGGVTLAWRDPFSLDNVHLKEQEYAFIAFDGLPVPFKITDTLEQTNGITVLFFERIENPDQAETIRNCELWIPKEWVSNEIEQGELHNVELVEDALLGRTVQNERGETVGIIKEVEIYPMNAVLAIETPNGETALIPLSEELVIQWPQGDGDPLQTNIPEGLEGVS